MDITSIGSLWKDYDVSALPLNQYALSEKTENGITVREYYFDGYTTVDGRVRTYIKIYHNPNAKGVVLYIPDSVGSDGNIINTLNESGYTVAALDYAGKADKNSRYTMYPRSLSDCNAAGQSKFEILNEAQYTRWFVWTCIARRAIKFISSLYEQSDIFAVGLGVGGSTVFKLAAFDDGLKACATLRNIIPNVSGSGNSLINYHASLDNTAYAPITRVPLFVAVSSNDEDGSFDIMSELAEATTSLKCFRVVERALANGISFVYPEMIRFFENFDNCGKIQPKITASNSQGSLYLNITLNKKDGEDVAEEKSKFDIRLFVSFCIEDIAYRNWMKLPIISLGDDVYIAGINVCNETKPINAFVNITDNNGNTYSSPLLMVIPKTLGIKPKPGVAHRKIYDGSMGEDGWTSRDGGNVSLVKGPFGIDGITGSTGSLLIFKLGDPLFKVPADTLLQLMMSGKAQTVEIKVIDKTTVYSAFVEITAEDTWNKFSLTHLNFKGSTGSLPDWSQIMGLELSFEKEFVLGSVLWV